jgi:hypothetical protein
VNCDSAKKEVVATPPLVAFTPRDSLAAYWTFVESEKGITISVFNLIIFKTDSPQKMFLTQNAEKMDHNIGFQQQCQFVAEK